MILLHGLLGSRPQASHAELDCPRVGPGPCGPGSGPDCRGRSEGPGQGVAERTASAKKKVAKKRYIYYIARVAPVDSPHFYSTK
jgi:hypothetical protein